MRQIILDFGRLHLLDHAFSLRLYGYGLMLVLGFLTGIYLARWRAKRAGENPDNMTHCGLLALVGGVVGSRLAYVIQHWSTQFATADNPLLAIINISSGGLIYYGGVVLAIVLVLAYLRIKRLSIRRYLDILAISAMVGLAFGRAGCLLNGCCYGGSCRADWPLATRFPMFSKPLLKLTDRANPFSAGTEGASPAYADQFEHGLVQPDERLVDPVQPSLLIPPRYLHGKLAEGQVTPWLVADETAWREAFAQVAGSDARIDEREWQEQVPGGSGPLRGAEPWPVAAHYDINQDGYLNFNEFLAYVPARRERLLARFDLDASGSLDATEQQAADEYLREDLRKLAGSSQSNPIKPAQALGIINALLLAGLLSGIYRLRRREGQVFAAMLVLYPITRFVLEIIRDDNPHNMAKGILTHNQYTSIATVAGGIILLAALQRLPAVRSAQARPAC